MNIVQRIFLVVLFSWARVICFNDGVEVLEKGGTSIIRGLGELHSVKFLGREWRYDIKEKYTFSVPNVSVNSHFYYNNKPHVCPVPNDDNTAAKEGFTFAFLSVGQLVDCPDYEICSEVNVAPSSKIYEGVCTKVPLLFSRFKYVYRSGNDVLTEELYVPSDIHRFALNGINVEIMSSDSFVPTLPPGCYIYCNNATNQCYTSKNPINEKNEFDVNKIGWYQTSVDANNLEEEQIVHITAAYNQNLTTCSPSSNLNLFQWELKAKQFYRNSLIVNDDGQSLSSAYGNVFESVSWNERNGKLDLTVRNFKEPSMSLRIKFEDPTADVKFTFKAETKFDLASKKYDVVLHVHGAPGTFHATIRVRPTKKFATFNTDSWSHVEHVMKLDEVPERGFWICLRRKEKKPELCVFVELASEELSQISPTTNESSLQEGFNKTSRSQEVDSSTIDESNAAGLSTSAMIVIVIGIVIVIAAIAILIKCKCFKCIPILSKLKQKFMPVPLEEVESAGHI